MAGIYVHFPFCKRKCHYCNFYSLASQKKHKELVNAICKEIELQKDYLGGEIIETIYFGGGTPSLMSISDINKILSTIFRYFKVTISPEITLEANPDDLDKQKILDLLDSGINRLSIGVQSFHNKDLLLLNRSHDKKQAEYTLETAIETGFNNISIDLIYGIPTLNNQNWIKNIEKAIKYRVAHISAYALTLEPKTAYHILIQKGKIPAPDDNKTVEHFDILIRMMKENDYIHYEISNFCKKNHYSLHNSNYWKQKKYLGIGPSAHSFDSKSRQWNVSNSGEYIISLDKDTIPFEREILTTEDKYNEYIMTGLRTMWGIDLIKIKNDFGLSFYKNTNETTSKYIKNNLMQLENEIMVLTDKGKLLADAIIESFFCISE